MAMTLEQINAERAAYGKEPLTELPKKAEDKSPEDTDLAKKKEELPEAKKKEEEEKPSDTPTDTELDEAKVLEYLRKKNPDLKSLDDLTPKPTVDPEKVAEEREAAKVSYGLQKGIFKKKDYDNYISDSKDPVNLVYDEYARDAKKDDPNLTDDEILEEFKSEYGLNAEKGSRKYNRGQKDLALRSQKILQDNYGKILSLDSDFTAYETAQNERKAYEQKILTETPVKKKEIEAAFEKLRKFNWEAAKDDVHEIEYPKEILDTVKKGLLDEKFVKTAIEQGWDGDKLVDVIDTTLSKAARGQLMKIAADKYLLKHKSGSRGIPELGKEKQEERIEPKLSKRQQEMYDEYMAEKAKSMPQPVAN